MSSKLHAAHLRRRAVVYIRQSTLTQLQENQESQRRQYALAERAKEMGFSTVDVIDEDLGRSAGGQEARPGFDRLVSLVCAAEVGAVFCIEASRLARNGRDWHHLIDLCALTATVLIDLDGIYDPRMVNDRLLLGLKGSMSEFELSLLRQRSQEAILQKARRGELQYGLPVGLEWTREGRIDKDPDQRVQGAIRLVFRKFTEYGSLRQVLMWFAHEEVTFPFILHDRVMGRQVGWKPPTYSTLIHVLRNPLYAGAYAFGKSSNRTRVIAGRAQTSRGHSKAETDWTVLIPEHHSGYISFPEYQRNLKMLAERAHRRNPSERKVGRGGRALLSGLMRCGRCGRRMGVNYGGVGGAVWRYVCRRANLGSGLAHCISFGGLKVDHSIGIELLRALQPSAVEAARLAAAQQDRDRLDCIQAAELEWKAAQYSAQLAARRYEEVDPHNRLVALELEHRWEEALLRASTLERKLAGLRTSSRVDEEPTLEQLLSLAQDLSAVWHHPEADHCTKQRLASLLIREIVCNVDVDRSEVVLVLHWQGGRHSELRVPKNRTGNNRHSTDLDSAGVMATMAGAETEAQIANTLNKLKLRTGHGKAWTESLVRSYLHNHGLPTYRLKQTPPGHILPTEAARRLGISVESVRKLISKGVLAATQVVPCAPYHILPAALEMESLKQAVAVLRAHPCSRMSKQQRASLQRAGAPDTPILSHTHGGA
jgi:DNA invertase Pin-like site-specific DNA recombinase